MTANFSFKRLLQLIIKQWVENRKMYLMSVLALVGLLGIVFAFWAAAAGPDYNEETLYGIGLIGLFITGGIFASTTFSMLGTGDKGIYWISFPASHLEKLLANLFYNVIIFSVVYFLCFLLLKTLAIGYVQLLIDKGRPGNLKKIDWNSENGINSALPYFVAAFFAVQAAFILGSVVFKKFSFIITTIIIAGFIFTFIYAIGNLSQTFLKGYSFNLFTMREWPNNNMPDSGTYKEYFVSPVLKYSILTFVDFLIAPILWFITWFKLKEKQL